MKLYEVNHQLEELLYELEPDPDTGEIPANEDEILAQIHFLAEERMDILQYLAKIALNTKADITALKEEESRLKSRRQLAERRHDRLIALLDRECGGEKTDLGVATLSYRHSHRVEITDIKNTLDWLQKNNHPECIKIPEPEIRKPELGKLLDAGEKIPGAEKVPSVSCSLK